MYDRKNCLTRYFYKKCHAYVCLENALRVCSEFCLFSYNLVYSYLGSVEAVFKSMLLVIRDLANIIFNTIHTIYCVMKVFNYRLRII